MNTRLIQLLETSGEMPDRAFLDDYNQAYFMDVAPTITTRIDQSSHYFIYERE